MCHEYNIVLEASEIVQHLIMSLFIKTYNTKSSKGKYITNSFSKCPSFQDVSRFIKGQRDKY